jgi:hypothetical protein
MPGPLFLLIDYAPIVAASQMKIQGPVRDRMHAGRKGGADCATGPNYCEKKRKP